MASRQLLLISSSRLQGFELLEQCRNQIDEILKKNNVSTVLFVPFAQQDYDNYTETMAVPFNKWGYQLHGIHTKPNQIDAIKKCEAIFIGGGNTFLLLKTLYEKNLMEPIREQILKNGIPYLGSSAGTNVATPSIQTTNDMPITYPPSFNGLNLVPFNINPHYIDTDPNSTHKGETRDQRLEEFMKLNNLPVLGLREGTSLMINGDNIKVLGINNTKYFTPDNEPKEYPPGSDLSFLLN